MTIMRILTGGPDEGVGTVEEYDGPGTKDRKMWHIRDRDGDLVMMVDAHIDGHVSITDRRWPGQYEQGKVAEIIDTEAVLLAKALVLAAAWSGHGEGSPGLIASGLGPEAAMAVEADQSD